VTLEHIMECTHNDAGFLVAIAYWKLCDIRLLTLVPATVFYTRIPATGESIQSYDARERLKISTSGKKCMVWNIFFYEMHISCCSRDPSGIQDGRQYGRSTMK